MRHQQKLRKFNNIRLIHLGILKGLILLAFIIFSPNAATQVLHVNSNNGTPATYNLANISKMSISFGKLTITKSDSTSGIYTLNELSNLSFVGYPNQVQKIKKEVLPLQAYPNPVVNNLHIKIPKPGKIEILGLDGKLMLTQNVTSKGIISIPVYFLESGIYICLYTNGQESKTFKIIKQ